MPKYSARNYYFDKPVRAKCVLLVHHRSNIRQMNRQRARLAWTLPHWRFQGLLTLFPKFFATFPHGTCLLSVSSKYLALGGIHLPISTVLSNSATRRARPIEQSVTPRERGSHPHRGTKAQCVRGLDDSHTLQVAIVIAICYARHRSGSRDIHRWWLFRYSVSAEAQ